MEETFSVRQRKIVLLDLNFVSLPLIEGISMLKAPAFLFPSQTVFIDNDILYPQIITSDIPNCPPITSCSDFDFILEQKNKNFLFLDNKKTPTDVFMTINSDINNKTCSLSDLVSVLIVDLNMEKLSGLELLDQIKSPFVYRVLISNYIGSKNEDAVKYAQNAGIIDEVIEKGRHLTNTLAKTIYRGQTKFFTRLSAQIFSGREHHNYLSDINVANKFLELINHFEPETIWPEQDLASFKLSTKQTPSSHVFFTTQNEIDALIACYESNQIPDHISKRLRNGEYIICHRNPQTLDIEEWPYFLRPAQKICGTNQTVLYQMTNESEAACF